MLDGDEFVINGQKTWNSLGHLADWCQLYVRTDPTVAKHKGISCLLVDLRSPGIDVRPLRTITGEQPFAELFFTDVRVPVSALLGPLHEGWKVAMTTLSFERAGVARLHLGLSKKLDHLLAEPESARALTDPRIRQRVAGIYADIACMRWMTNRSLEQMRSGQPTGATGSMAKLSWGRTEQKLADLAMDVLGEASVDQFVVLQPHRRSTDDDRRWYDRDQPQHPGRGGSGSAPRAQAGLTPRPFRRVSRPYSTTTARSGQFASASLTSRTSPPSTSPSASTCPNPLSSQPNTSGARV